jgi:hypothetical protein
MSSTTNQVVVVDIYVSLDELLNIMFTHDDHGHHLTCSASSQLCNSSKLWKSISTRIMRIRLAPAADLEDEDVGRGAPQEECSIRQPK